MLVLEYIWLDCNTDFRSKTKIMDYYSHNFDKNTILNSLPIWNYDGSSTGQATGKDSEILMKPVAVFMDPFRKNENINLLVMCDTYDKNMNPLKNNYRPFAESTLGKYKEQEPWFGLEQEYFIINPKTNLPLGFCNGEPAPQGNYYCSVGAGRAIGREVVEKHLEYSLYAGLKVGGINAEVAPGQWEFQVGPLNNVDVGDHLMVARYILNRVAEEFGYNISYHPKPLGKHADWNGSGCHTNFSTKDMRDHPEGLKYIYTGIENLGRFHKVHMESYGEHNTERLSGLHETSNINDFTVGVGNRGSSIRIPNETLKKGKGYFEDRRPAANMNPYLVSSLVLLGVNNNG